MKLSDPGAAAIIGAGAALTGVLLSGVMALVIDGQRRRWEDDRRWYDARRLAYVNFHYTARRALGAAGRAAQLSVKAVERKERGHSKSDPELDSLMKTVQEESDRISEWADPMNQASAEIDLLGSEPVKKAARERFEIYEAVIGVFGPDRLTTTAAKHKERLVDLDIRQAEATEAFRQAAREDLGVKSPRRWWQVWRR
jgi:hypothetical protein